MADDDEKPGEGAMPRRPVDLAGRKGLDTERLTAVTTPLAKQLAELERLSQPGRELQERDIRDILATMQGGADRDEVQPSDR